MRLHCTTSDNGEVPVLRVTQTGATSSGSAVVTGLADTTQLVGALSCAGQGVPSATFVRSIDSATQVTLTQPATASASVPLTFQIEPVNLPDMKSQLRVDFPDDDALIAAKIKLARRYCEVAKKQALLTQTWVLYLDSFPSAGGYYNRAIREVWPSLGGLPSGLGFYPGLIPNSTGVIDVPLPPLQTLVSVQYVDFAGTLQTVPSSSYNVSLGTPARVQPAYSKVWPISRPTIDSVQVTFTSGFGPTADKLADSDVEAVKLMVDFLYYNRGDAGGEIPAAVGLCLGLSEHGSYG